MSTTNEHATQDFDRDGFAIVRRFLPEDQRKELVDRLKQFMDKVAPQLDPRWVFCEQKRNLDTMMRVEHLNIHEPFFDTLVQRGPFRELAEAALGPVVPQSMGVFGKPPRVGKATPPHQDAFYWMIDPPKALTIWMAIDEADEENGCVRYVPGSHRLGMREHQLSQVLGFSQYIADFRDEEKAESVPACVAPGDVIMHHGMTIHYADSNPTDRRRRAMGIVYYSEAAQVDQRLKANRVDAKAMWKATDRI